MKGSLIIYKKIFKMEDADKQIIRQLLIKEGSYLVKGIKNGHHISIENIELNQDTVSKIQEIQIMIEKYANYDEDIFHKQFRQLKDPNYNGKCIQNKVKIGESNKNYMFENNDQKQLYTIISRKMDQIFFNGYFNEVRFDLVEFLKKEYRAYNLDDMVNSHISHFWAYFCRLSRENKMILMDAIREEKSMRKYIILDEELFPYIVSQMQKLTEQNKVDYFSPNKQKDSFTNTPVKYASLAHKKTFQNQDEMRKINKDYVLIANRWFLNLLYEKMILMNMSVLDRLILNYRMGQLSQTINLQESIEYTIRSGKEILT